MVLWNLNKIISKVRNVTGTPDELPNNDIIDYINTYYTFIMPYELKEQINLQPLNFFALPNIDVYQFPGAFLTDQPMAYADGFPLIFYQDRDIFFQDWPQQYAQDAVSTGDGVTTTFAGTTQNNPVIKGTYVITDGSQTISDVMQVPITEVIDIGTGVAAYSALLASFPIQPGTLSVTDGVEIFDDDGLGNLIGNLGGVGSIFYSTGVLNVTFNTAVAVGVEIIGTYSLIHTSGVLSGNGFGSIDYVSGAFSATFNSAPLASDTIYDKYQGYQPARPQGVLFYNNTFTFRPIPDQVYSITMQGYINQIQFENDSDMALQPEWGILIAYGASVEIFADRGDLVAYKNTYDIMKRYENIALGRTVQQYEASQSVPRF